MAPAAAVCVDVRRRWLLAAPAGIFRCAHCRLAAASSNYSPSSESHLVCRACSAWLFRYQVSCSCCNSNQGVAAAFAGPFSHDHTSLLWDLERRILKRSSLRRSGMTSSDQASRSEVSDTLSMPFLRVCAPTPPGFSQCGLCGASAQDLDLRSCVRPISTGSGASLSALSSPASASLRSVVATVGFTACTGSCAAAQAARTGHS